MKLVHGFIPYQPVYSTSGHLVACSTQPGRHFLLSVQGLGFLHGALQRIDDSSVRESPGSGCFGFPRPVNPRGNLPVPQDLASRLNPAAIGTQFVDKSSYLRLRESNSLTKKTEAFFRISFASPQFQILPHKLPDTSLLGTGEAGALVGVNPGLANPPE